MNRRAWAFCLVALSILGVAGCSWHQSGRNSVRLGSILGLTGDGAAYGKKMQRGFELALDETNAAGGVRGGNAELVIEDSRFDPTQAVLAYRKLTGAQGIKIIVGITGSKNALPVCQASKSSDVVIIDALGSAPKLTTDGGPNYFRIMASDALAGKYNVDWAMESRLKRPAIVYVEDDWGASYRDSVVQYLRQKGYASVPSYGVTAGSRDFRTQVEKIKGNNPDAVFMLVYAKEGSGLMQQLRQASVRAMIYGSDNISSPEFVSAGADVVEGVRLAMPAAVHGSRYDAFAKTYSAKYGEVPDANIIKSYDAMKLACAVIQKVGPQPDKIREYLQSPRFSYDGVSGRIQFDKNGDLVSQEYARMVYRHGKPVPTK